MISLNSFNDIKSEKIRLEDVEKDRLKFELKLSSIRVGGKK